jgi:hypothetical protein
MVNDMVVDHGLKSRPSASVWNAGQTVIVWLPVAVLPSATAAPHPEYFVESYTAPSGFEDCAHPSGPPPHTAAASRIAAIVERREHVPARFSSRV